MITKDAPVTQKITWVLGALARNWVGMKTKYIFFNISYVTRKYLFRSWGPWESVSELEIFLHQVTAPDSAHVCLVFICLGLSFPVLSWLTHLPPPSDDFIETFNIFHLVTVEASGPGDYL